MDDKIETKQDLSSLWIKNNVYDSLEKIELYERFMRTGFKNIFDYIEQINLTPEMIVGLQLKNMELMIVELDILIENVKSLLLKKVYDEIRIEIDSLLVAFKKGLKKELPYRILKNQKDKLRTQVLTEVFYIIEKHLLKLRSEMVSNLSHLLFLQDKHEEQIQR
ncbi:hypothetical protein LCGC14_1458370 [marine sediment metagenome]|uniref:Uncharacterized protein n=1 Tax=marine sediment metagenome TaxID=412755 RepID=A0A0F9JGG2_9ZZZZ